MVAEVTKLHMFLHVVVIKVFFHPPNITPIQIPVTFPALTLTAIGNVNKYRKFSFNTMCKCNCWV